MSCGTSSRPGGSSDRDASTDSDTSPSLVWTFGNEDYDITLPNRLCDHHEWDTFPAVTLHEGYVALPIARGDDNDDGLWAMRLATMPDLEPWNTTVNVFQEDCGIGPSNSRAVRAFPNDEGFVVMATTTRAPDDWFQLAVSRWAFDGEVIGDSHGYSSSQWEDSAVFPSGFVDEDGSVVIGTLTYDDSLTVADEPVVVFRLDKFGPDPSTHGLFFRNSYSWAQHADQTDSIHSSIAGASTFLWNGEVTVVGRGYYNQGVEGNGLDFLVIARGDMSSLVIQEPEIFHSAPTSETSVHPVHHEWSLTQRKGTVLLLENTSSVLSGDPMFNLEHSVVSYVFSMQGDLLFGPIQLATFRSNSTWGQCDTILQTPLARWSGEYFGVCYFDSASTFQFMLLDENGQMLKNPAPIFWDIPASMYYPHTCDIVALDEETFLVVMSAASDEDGGDTPGLWAVYVHANPPE